MICKFSCSFYVTRYAQISFTAFSLFFLMFFERIPNVLIQRGKAFRDLPNPVGRHAVPQRRMSKFGQRLRWLQSFRFLVLLFLREGTCF